MPKYKLTKKALADVDKIWAYTAEQWSIEQADRYYNLIFDEIEYVAENFGTARDMNRLRSGYRYSRIGSHLIFFRATHSGEIEVVRILHGRMDIESRLRD